MKFQNNTIFNDKFEKIEAVRFYPYVGKQFPNQQKRILVFAHNMYTEPEKHESEQLRTTSKTHFANAMEEFTYQQKWWTKTFRNFVKGSLAINENFTSNSSIEIVARVDQFVEKISYINYINDIVPSNRANNVTVETELIQKSHHINKEFIKILDTTHIVCWGKQVFNYLLSQPDITIKERIKNFEKNEGLKNRKGFEYVKIELDGKTIHILKVFHPSMPSFGQYNVGTQNIMNWFYRL
jgi:uracil-DNA glycosylase